MDAIWILFEVNRHREPPGDSSKPGRLQLVQRFLETVGVGAFGFTQGLKPVGDLVETLVSSGLSHARIHVGYSWVSPAMAALRLSDVPPMGSPVAGSPTS